jgi:hypothetical protein
MKRLLTIIIFCLFLTFELKAQIIKTSELYNSNGRLLADSTIFITKKQFNKWASINDSLTKNILNNLQYPENCYKNGIYATIIISFNIDSDGTFYNYKLEKYFCERFKVADSLDPFLRMFEETIINSIMLFSGKYTSPGFKSDNNLLDKYYIPVDFSCNIPPFSDTTIRQIKNGWLSISKTHYGPYEWKEEGFPVLMPEKLQEENIKKEKE